MTSAKYEDFDDSVVSVFAPGNLKRLKYINNIEASDILVNHKPDT